MLFVCTEFRNNIFIETKFAYLRPVGRQATIIGSLGRKAAKPLQLGVSRQASTVKLLGRQLHHLNKIAISTLDHLLTSYVEKV